MKTDNELQLFDGEVELKRHWTNYIFPLPVIPFNGGNHIVDMELFIQLFFAGQDGKDTSTIFNAGYYHKVDFKNMILSYAKSFSQDISQTEIMQIKDKIAALKSQKHEKIKLCDFYREISPATEYLSGIKDKEEFYKKVSEMDRLTEKISDIRKKRNNYASRKSLWTRTLNELKSLNRTIEVGELRCMDCNSTNIAFRGTGKAKYSFDVSTPEMRSQIINSIQMKIESYIEEIERCNFEIEKLRSELSEIMNEEDVTLENILMYKNGFNDISDIENAIKAIDSEINNLSEKLISNSTQSSNSKKSRDDFYSRLIDKMNEIRLKMDPKSSTEYSDLFTKRGSVVSGSEETIYYAARILAINSQTKHVCPLIIDSFRAEDLSTDKESTLLKLFAQTNKQCILTTTLKKEERGKYSSDHSLNVIDYTDHVSNKLLKPSSVNQFLTILSELGIAL